MNDVRPPLAAVPGLAKGITLPPPPPRSTAKKSPAHSNPPEQLVGEAPDRPTIAVDDDPVAEAIPQRRSRSRAAAAATPTAEGTMQAITLSLPAALVVALKTRAREDRVTQPETLMDALSANHDRLTDLVAEAQAPAISDGLFLRKRNRTNNEPMATLSLRLLSGNVEAIDRLAATSGAPSRSALCAAALRAYLTAE